MAEHDWQQLMDDPEVRTIIERTLATHGRRYYWRRADALAFDDLQSWIWDHAVDCAISHDPSRFEGVVDPRALFLATLTTNLRKAITEGWHRTSFYGGPGTERSRQSYFQTSLDALAEATPGADRGIEGFFLAKHVLTRDDPLHILLRREHLEQMLRHAHAGARNAGMTVVTREADPYCSEPMCLAHAVKTGRCERHYQRYRALWISELCTVDGCTNGAIGKGLCNNHLKQSYATDPDRPRCTHPDGCDGAATRRDLCGKHYQAAYKAGTLEPKQRHTHCTVPGCDAAHYSKGMCRPHYRRQAAK